MLLHRLQASFCHQKTKHVYVGRERCMNYENFISLKCGFTAVRIHVVFAAFYCYIRSGSIAWGRTDFSCRKGTHVCTHALCTPALHFREQRNFRGWVEENERSFPASCGNKVNGANQINQGQTNLDSGELSGCLSGFRFQIHWPIGLTVYPNSLSVCFSFV